MFLISWRTKTDLSYSSHRSQEHTLDLEGWENNSVDCNLLTSSGGIFHEVCDVSKVLLACHFHSAQTDFTTEGPQLRDLLVFCAFLENSWLWPLWAMQSYWSLTRCFRGSKAGFWSFHKDGDQETKTQCEHDRRGQQIFLVIIIPYFMLPWSFSRSIGISLFLKSHCTAYLPVGFVQNDDLVPSFGQRDLLLSKHLDLVPHHVDAPADKKLTVNSQSTKQPEVVLSGASPVIGGVQLQHGVLHRGSQQSAGQTQDAGGLSSAGRTWITTCMTHPGFPDYLPGGRWWLYSTHLQWL